MKRGMGVLFVLVMLVLQPLVLAENQDDCNFWCKVTSFFTPRENIAGSATCTGFWECLLQRGNIAGRADG